MTLSPATPQQAEALAEVHALGFSKPWSASDIATALAWPGAYGFLVLEDRPVGMILCRVAADDAELLTLAVAPHARRRGIARTLVDAAAQTGRAAGATAMFLEVAMDNAGALTLYEQAGFRRIALRTDYYDRGISGTCDAAVLRLDLPPDVP